MLLWILLGEVFSGLSIAQNPKFSLCAVNGILRMREKWEKQGHMDNGTREQG
jgi:hypothetical protein